MPAEFEIMIDLSPSSTQGGSFALAHSISNNLTDFIGNCTVFEMESGDGDISAAQVEHAISVLEEELKSLNRRHGIDFVSPCRFLFKTKSNDGTGGRFLSSAALKVLSDRGAQLVGIDMAKLAADVLLEQPKFSYIVNLCLNFVGSGNNYKLLAPPLLMTEISPVPVRPILVS